jgi:hypothetical protein
MEVDHAKLSLVIGTNRFGSIAVYRKYVTLDHVQRALAEQIEDNVMRRPHRRLSEILREHNWITEEQIQSVLEEMGVGEE